MDFRNLLGTLNQLNESIEEANESPEQRLEAIKAAYEAGVRNLKTIEQMLMMTPPGGNRDQYEADLDWQQKRLATLKKDHQALEAGIKGADDIRANAQANAEGLEEAADDATLIAQELKKMGVSSNASEDEISNMIPKALKNLDLESVLNHMNISKGYKQDMLNDIIVAFSGMKDKGFEEGVVSDMRLSPKMQEWLKNATDEEINRMVFASGDDSLRAGAEVERLKKARAELQGQTGESFDRDAFRESFMRMVEAKGKKPNDGNLANNAKPYDKVTRADVIAGATGNDEMGGKKKKKKADESVKEGKSKHPKGSPAYKRQMAAKHASMNESFEKFINNEQLSFEEAVKIVRESGGQQKIDPVDTALWNWAQRVAANKFTESRKAEMFAGLIYERNGGEFQIHDVLSED